MILSISSFIKKHQIVINTSIALIALIVSVLIGYKLIGPEKSYHNLEIIQTSKSSVIDINEEIKDLVITYKNIDLSKSKKTLTLFNIRIQNSGNRTLKTSDFADYEYFGLDITNGEIIKMPTIIESYSKVLSRNFKSFIDTNGNIRFTKIGFEPSEFITIKFLLLHNKFEKPILNAMGKIYEQKTLQVQELNMGNEANEPERLFSIIVIVINGILIILILRSNYLRKIQNELKKNIILNDTNKFIERQEEIILFLETVDNSKISEIIHILFYYKDCGYRYIKDDFIFLENIYSTNGKGSTTRLKDLENLKGYNQERTERLINFGLLRIHSEDDDSIGINLVGYDLYLRFIIYLEENMT